MSEAAGYVRRVLDDELDALLTGLPALAIDGPKGVGKTTLAAMRARTVLRLDAPESGSCSRLIRPD